MLFEGLKMIILFSSIPIGTRFQFGQTVWVKKSTRTAIAEQYKKTFYFCFNDRVKILGVKNELF